MEDFTGRYAITDAGRGIGTLTVRREGLYYLFQAACIPGRELLRLELLTDGAAVPLGVCVPGDGGRVLSRRVSLSSLRAMGVRRLDGCRAAGGDAHRAADSAASGTASAATHGTAHGAATGAMDGATPEAASGIAGGAASETASGAAPARNDTGTPPGWRAEPEPGRLFSCPELREACASLRGALLRTEGAGRELAVPLRPEEPFPLLPVFRYGSARELGGGAYWVFSLENGEIV